MSENAQCNFVCFKPIVFKKCIALNFLKLHLLLACACSIECDYRARHILIPVVTLISVSILSKSGNFIINYVIHM